MTIAELNERLKSPMDIKCPNCKYRVKTVIKYTPGTKTYIWAVAICLLGGVLCCFIIPFFLKCSRYVGHFCPKCDEYIGESDLIRASAF